MSSRGGQGHAPPGPLPERNGTPESSSRPMSTDFFGPFRSILQRDCHRDLFILQNPPQAPGVFNLLSRQASRWTQAEADSTVSSRGFGSCSLPLVDPSDLIRVRHMTPSFFLCRIPFPPPQLRNYGRFPEAGHRDPFTPGRGRP